MEILILIVYEAKNFQDKLLVQLHYYYDLGLKCQMEANTFITSISNWNIIVWLNYAL